jgi:hypothetical protein
MHLAKGLEVLAVADLVVCATTRSSRRETGYFAGISGKTGYGALSRSAVFRFVRE